MYLIFHVFIRLRIPKPYRRFTPITFSLTHNNRGQKTELVYVRKSHKSLDVGKPCRTHFHWHYTLQRTRTRMQHFSIHEICATVNLPWKYVFIVWFTHEWKNTPSSFQQKPMEKFAVWKRLLLMSLILTVFDFVRNLFVSRYTRVSHLAKVGSFKCIDGFLPGNL